MNAFGRLEAPDERDWNYPMSAVVLGQVRPYRYWNDNQWWGDQGNKPWCVAYAILHLAEDGPVTHKKVPPPLLQPAGVYNRAQQIDEWPGTNYDGTSVRAGMKVLQENGIIAAYHWAADYNDIIHAIEEIGPVVMGTKFYEGMARPDKDGFMHPTGRVLGGHAYVLNGYNAKARYFRMKNSWGRSWGNKGRAKIGFDEVAELLYQNGEACIGIEARD